MGNPVQVKNTLIFSGFLLSCIASVSAAEQTSDSRVDISGFGTLGISESNSSQYGFRNDFSQNNIAYQDDYSFSPLSNIGVQIDAIVNPEWDFVAQWVYREQDEHTIDALTTMAFARYSPNTNWKIRLGRTALDLFHLSEYRDVGIAYAWAKVPTEVYGFVPSRSIDGIDAVYIKDVSGVNVSVKGYAGQFDTDFTSSGYDPIYFKDIFGLRLTAETFDWSINLRHSQARVEKNNETISFVVDQITNAEPLWPNAREFAAELSMDDKTVTYSSISGQYNFYPFLVMGEYAYIDADSSILNSVTNGYLSLIYHTDPHSFYVTHSFTDSTAYFFDEFVLAPQLLAPLITIVERQKNAFATDQITRSLGWRYDIADNIALKLQWDHTHFKGRGSALIGSDIVLVEREDGQLNTLHLTMSFSY